MGVLKSLRRRNPDKGLRNKKHLNYSAMSNDSGNTHETSKDDPTDDAFFASLIERENLTVCTTASPDQGAGPQVVSPLASPKMPMQETGADEQAYPLLHSENKTTKPKMTMEPKRTSLEPIAPLGVVVNEDNEKEDEWDAISHISGISTRSESSTAKKNLSSEEIKKDLETMAASFDGRAKAIVSPECKKESSDNSKDDSSKDGSLVQSMIQNFESGGMNHNKSSDSSNNNVRAVDILVHDDTPSPSKAKHMDRIVRILKSVNEKKEGGNVNNCCESSETGSKVSHVFEDDQDSNNVISDTSGESPIYSPSITVSAQLDTSTPSLEAVFTMKTEEPKQKPPGINGAVAPSFDGSTATACTDNTSPNKKVDTFQTSQDKWAKSPEFTFAPSCDSIFSSPTAISANLKNSLEQIKKELNEVYESSASGLASAAAKVEEQVGAIKFPQPFFSKKSTVKYVQPKYDEETLETEATNETEESPRTGGETMSENDKEFFKRTVTQGSF